MNNFSSKANVLLIFFIALVLSSSVFYALIIHTGKLGSGFGSYVRGLMWCPAFSAVTASLICKRNLSLLGWKWGETKYQIQSYLTPFLYALIAYLIIWSFSFGIFYNTETVKNISEAFGFAKLPDWLAIILYLFFLGVCSFPASIASGLGEEIGWRGFLVPELYKKIGYTKTSLLVGIIWSLWHYPILIFADYNNGAPAWYGLTCFTILVISVSFIFAYFRLKSGSLWTGVILHTSHNLFIQEVFTPLTKYTERTKYYIDEFGCVLPVVCLCFAIYFWTKRKTLPDYKNYLTAA